MGKKAFYLFSLQKGEQHGMLPEKFSGALHVSRVPSFSCQVFFMIIDHWVCMHWKREPRMQPHLSNCQG